MHRGVDGAVTAEESPGGLRDAGDRLPRRPWTRAAGIQPLTLAGTTAAVLASVLVTAALPVPVRALIVVGVIGVGVGVFVAARARWGREAMHRRVGAVRRAWCRQHGRRFEGDGDADPVDIRLALPRGWRVLGTRGRMRCALAGGVEGRVETWMLRASPGSSRGERAREVVVVPARVPGLAGRPGFAVERGLSIDPALISPVGSGRENTAEPVWADEVRAAVAAHRDVAFTVVVGEDRVLLFALDDPRPRTSLARLELARTVAAIASP